MSGKPNGARTWGASGWLTGGGEMGKLIREMNWSKTPLGPIESWPQSLRMFLDRNGYLEETFFTFSFSPIRDETGEVGGLFHPVTEMTNQTLAERRLKVLRDLADRTADAKTVEEACTLIAAALGEHELDLPFALLFLFDADGKRATLAASSGIQPGTAISPDSVDLSQEAPTSWPLAEVARAGQIEEVNDLERRLGPFSCGPYPEPPKTAYTLPILLPGLEQTFGALVAGVSSRRALDDAYRTFYRMLSDSVSNALASARDSNSSLTASRSPNRSTSTARCGRRLF